MATTCVLATDDVERVGTYGLSHQAYIHLKYSQLMYGDNHPHPQPMVSRRSSVVGADSCSYYSLGR